MTPIQIILCKLIAEKENKERIVSAINILVVTSVLELIILVFGCIPLMRYLKFSFIIDYILFAILVYANNGYIVFSGIVQGKQKFLLLGIVNVLMYSLKFVISTLLGKIGLGVDAVIIGLAIAELFCIMLYSSKNNIKHLIRIYSFSIDGSMIKQYAYTFVLYMFVSLYLNNGDLLIGNMYCDPNEIGLYSVAINLSKISFFLIATPVATIVFPKISAESNIQKRRTILFFSEGLTVLASLLYGLVFFVIGKPIISMLYGESYEGAADYILVCSMFVVVLGFFWIYYQYMYAVNMLELFTKVTMVIGIITFAITLYFRIKLIYIPVAMCISMILTVAIALSIDYMKRKELDMN